MTFTVRGFLLALALMQVFGRALLVRAEEKPAASVVTCAAPRNDFENEVWTKIGAARCLTCHRAGGDAGESAFVLTDLNRTELTARAEAMRSNRWVAQVGSFEPTGVAKPEEVELSSATFPVTSLCRWHTGSRSGNLCHPTP